MRRRCCCLSGVLETCDDVLAFLAEYDSPSITIAEPDDNCLSGDFCQELGNTFLLSHLDGVIFWCTTNPVTTWEYEFPFPYPNCSLGPFDNEDLEGVQLHIGCFGSTATRQILIKAEACAIQYSDTLTLPVTIAELLSGTLPLTGGMPWCDLPATASYLLS